MLLSFSTLTFAVSFVIEVAVTQTTPFQPCLLLGARIPAPRIDPSSPEIRAASQYITSLLEDYIAAADGTFGPISPNTTSFSFSLFAGENYVADKNDQPFFYEFHHTAPSALSACNGTEDCRANSDSKYATGALTQLFTILTWLAEAGDGVWARSITDYLPEFIASSNAPPLDPVEQVQWRDVTLGSLAGHLAGVARDCN